MGVCVLSNDSGWAKATLPTERATIGANLASHAVATVDLPENSSAAPHTGSADETCACPYHCSAWVQAAARALFANTSGMTGEELFWAWADATTRPRPPTSRLPGDLDGQFPKTHPAPISAWAHAAAGAHLANMSGTAHPAGDLDIRSESPLTISVGTRVVDHHVR